MCKRRSSWGSVRQPDTLHCGVGREYVEAFEAIGLYSAVTSHRVRRTFRWKYMGYSALAALDTSRRLQLLRFFVMCSKDGELNKPVSPLSFLRSTCP